MKTVGNMVTKFVQGKYYKDCGIILDPSEVVQFNPAQDTKKVRNICSKLYLTLAIKENKNLLWSIYLDFKTSFAFVKDS